jgi:hypothetical protein
MAHTPRPYGRGPYGTSTYSTYHVRDVGGLSIVTLGAQGEMIRTWQQPSHVCEPGVWTLTTLPTGPPNELELVA